MEATKNKPVIFLEGRKTILRPINKATDVIPVTRWINDPEVTVFLKAYSPHSEESEKGWFESLDKDKNNIVLAIEAKIGSDGEIQFIGLMGIHHIDWRLQSATTGAIIGEKEFWGKGFGTDAKMILLDYAFNTLGLRKICSSVIAYNKRSLNYSLHCGYKLEGTFRKHSFRKGKYWDAYQLGIFKEEWLPIWRHYKKTGKIRK